MDQKYNTNNSSEEEKDLYQKAQDQVQEDYDEMQIPFVNSRKNSFTHSQIPRFITHQLQTKVYALEEPKFQEKVKETNKYEIKTYEVTMLVQILKNEDKLDLVAEDRIKKKFQTLLLQMFDDPKPMRISKIDLNLDVYPYQAEMVVDFITRIGKDPFHKVDLAPINYREKGPENAQNPRYIVNYFLAIKEQTNRYPEDFIILAKLGQGAFGDVELVKYRRNNQIYALKIMKKLSEKELKAILKFDDTNYGSNNNVVREILFLKNLRDVVKIKHPNIVELETFWVQKDKEGNYRLYILMQYFGGTDYTANCVFDFFYPNEGKSMPLHLDIGETGGRECLGQIFYQAIEVISFLHQHGHIHRDIKDDNFLIRRREGFQIDNCSAPYSIEISLCDFGMTGYIDKSCSLPSYNPNRYRDSDNINEQPAACDIFSLGEFLHMLIVLYHFYWKRDTEVIEKQYYNVYKEEWALSKRMKAPIKDRPKNMQQLKESEEYKNWIKVLPTYIPKFFSHPEPKN